jgi:hypothetical protein
MRTYATACRGRPSHSINNISSGSIMTNRLFVPAIIALAATAAAAQTITRSIPAPTIEAPIFKCDFCLAAQGISPLEAGASGVRIDARYLALGTYFGQEADPASEEENEQETHFTQQYSLFYMINPELTVSGIVPLPHRHSTETEEDGTVVSADQFGLGDISLLAHYKVLTEHDLETTTILSVAGGVKLPTGRTDGTNEEGELLDAHMQLGTGSTDLLVGGSGLIARDRVALATNLLASIPSAGANGHRFGNSLNYDATFRYRIYPSEVDVQEIFLGLGLYGELRGHETEDGETVDDSGGHVLYLGPTIQVNLTSTLSLEGSYHYPVLHSLNGRQLGEDYRLTGGAMLLF